ncbi:hypothetical protein [Nocardia asiatica]|uniref:hypothetical protein n=1 Tax=Nocardia asiatica TaxID=209252 RepID=UPI003EE220CF
MNQIVTAGVVTVALALLAGGTFFVLPYLLDRDDALPESAVPVTDIFDRLDIEHAHATMQDHVRCSIIPARTKPMPTGHWSMPDTSFPTNGHSGGCYDLARQRRYRPNPPPDLW